jgi:hypothetical protein
VQQCLRFSRRDGAALFQQGYDSSHDEPLLATAHELLPKRRQRRIPSPKQLLGGKASSDASKWVRPSAHSDDAGAALLRRDWSRSSDRLAVQYPQAPTWAAGRSPMLPLQLWLGADLVFAGDWRLELRVDGESREQTTPWSETLWSSDADVDYLELQAEFGDGVKVQRHLMLARQDKCLFLADAVRASGDRRIEYRGTLPLGDNITLQTNDEASEIIVHGSKQRAIALPLALPEWKADRRYGRLQAAERALVLEQTGQGQALMAPLWFSLKEKYDEALTWRQLTVAETLMQQPRDRAVGYRVQVGKRQWLLYRSLTPRANRTVLGHNLSTEFLVARFRRSGEVSTLIEVE